jgi:hypothetical protein
MKKAFLIIAIFSISSTLFAQTSSTDPVDVEGWYGANFAFNLKKKWTAEFDYQARYQNNLKSYKGSYFSFAGSKSISKRIDLLGEYRLSKVAKGTYHRFSFGAEYGKKFKAINWGFRVLVLNNIQDFLDPTQASQSAGYWRTRLKIGFKFNKKWEGYVSSEPIMKFGGNKFVDNWRNTVGVKRKITSHTKLDLFYMYRPDYAKTKYNRVYHVVGFNLDFKIPTKHK